MLLYSTDQRITKRSRLNKENELDHVANADDMELPEKKKAKQNHAADGVSFIASLDRNVLMILCGRRGPGQCVQEVVEH